MFQKSSGMEEKYEKEGVSYISVEIFLSYSAEKFRGGTLLSSRKFLVWKKNTKRMGVS